MNKVQLNQDIFDKTMSVVMSLPYRQVAGLVSEISANLEVLQDNGNDDVPGSDDAVSPTG
jgi:hypothetical protein